MPLKLDNRGPAKGDRNRQRNSSALKIDIYSTVHDRRIRECCRLDVLRACTGGCDGEVFFTARERVDRISEQAIAYFYHRYRSAVIAGQRVMSRKKRVYHRQVITGIDRSLHRPAAFNMEHACPSGEH